MSLRLYNSLTREEEPFLPATPGQIGMYVCGVTPYDLSHVGHARSALVFDVIRRYLSFLGSRVRFVKNFTDVEDKIIARAAQTGEPWQELVARYIQAYEVDMAWLGVAPPTDAPRATAHIAAAAGRPYRMVTLIERLCERGVAYVVEGDVYFEIRRFPAYGRLSGRDLGELRAGARVEVDERKRDPLDFALWKASKPGEPSWPSPWGAGRPGWHIECSAMAMEYLGESFDLHGGGQDLIFPHHENEIAQSEGATGKPFVRYWLHNGFVNLAAEKMSKSLGNTLTIEALRHHPGEAVRLYLIGTHYRGPLDFVESRIDEARRARERLAEPVTQALRLAGPAGVPGSALVAADWERVDAELVTGLLAGLAGDGLAAEVGAVVARFREAMDDDFNTPQALGVLFDLSRGLNRYRDAGLGDDRLARFGCGAAVLLALARALGLLWELAPAVGPGEGSAEIEALVRDREAARQRRDWKAADALRVKLDALGVELRDAPAGTEWKWKPGSTRP